MPFIYCGKQVEKVIKKLSGNSVIELISYYITFTFVWKKKNKYTHVYAMYPGWIVRKYLEIDRNSSQESQNLILYHSTVSLRNQQHLTNIKNQIHLYTDNAS